MASAALQAVAILERDTNGDILPVWMFPSLDSKLKSVFRARSGLDSSEPTALASPFRFSKFSKHWLYQLSFPVSTTAQPKVSAASVCLVSSKFNPQKYQALLVLLVKAYADECSPLPVMQAFLDVTTTGKHGSFENGAFDDRRALLSPVVPLFKAFGVETILIWQAMLLRKRVFVFADKLEELLPLVRSFPLIGAWHRLDWSIVRPFVRVDNALEMEDLQKSGVYVAGFTQEEASNHRDLFDVFVNLSDSNITVAEHAKADFALTKYHKKLAGEFLEAASGGADQAVIKVVALKTKQLLSRLASLKDEDGRITEDGLREHELPVGMDRFLFNVAKAEKMT